MSSHAEHSARGLRRSTETHLRVFEALHDALEAGAVRINGYPDARDVTEHGDVRVGSVQTATMDLEELGLISRHRSMAISRDGRQSAEVTTYEPLVGVENAREVLR